MYLLNYQVWLYNILSPQYTEVEFTRFPFGSFTNTCSGYSESTGQKTATSHLCAMYTIYFFLYKIFGLPQTLVIIRKIIFSLKSCPLLLVFYGSTFHMKQRWHCCQSCIRRTCGPQNRPLRTDLKQTEATLLLLWSWNSSITWPQWGQKLFEVAFEYLCLTPMIMQGRNGEENFVATSAIIGRICSSARDRVKVS